MAVGLLFKTILINVFLALLLITVDFYRLELVLTMNLHMGRSVQMILFSNFKEQLHITKETELMFVVSTFGVNVLEVLNVLIGMKCLLQESCPSKI